MEFMIGSMLILSMIAVAVFGPEVVVKLGGKPMRTRRRVRVTSDRRVEVIAGRRRNPRP